MCGIFSHGITILKSARWQKYTSKILIIHGKIPLQSHNPSYISYISTWGFCSTYFWPLWLLCFCLCPLYHLFSHFIWNHNIHFEITFLFNLQTVVRVFMLFFFFTIHSPTLLCMNLKIMSQMQNTERPSSQSIRKLSKLI